MELSYHQLQQLLLYPIGERELIRAIKLLQRNFTSNRRRIDQYLESSELVSAYTLFYLPTNLSKFTFVLSQLEDREKEEFLSCDFIDFGTGPGTYILAFLNQLHAHGGQKIVGVDQSDLMLKQACKNIETLFPDFRNVVLRDCLPLDLLNDKSKKVLCMGHSFNEMIFDDVIEIIKQSDPHYIFLVEPGTPAAFVEVLKLKKWLNLHGYGTLYPCLNSDCSCPMEGSSNWCHQVIIGSHHSSIERISQMAQLDRRSMPMIAHLYKKDYTGVVQDKGRLIRILTETKFSFEIELCLQQDNQLKLQVVEVYKKTLSKKDIKKIRTLSSGNTCTFNKVKELAEKWRVELTSF